MLGRWRRWRHRRIWESAGERNQKPTGRQQRRKPFALLPNGFSHRTPAPAVQRSAQPWRHLLRASRTHDKARSTRPAIEAILDGKAGRRDGRRDRLQSRAPAGKVEGAEDLSPRPPIAATRREELEDARQRGEQAALRYEGRWRDRDPSGRRRRAVHIRIRAQRGQTIIQDRSRAGSGAQQRADHDPARPRPPTTCSLWSTITTWRQQSSAATTISTTLRQRTIIRAMGWPEPVTQRPSDQGPTAPSFGATRARRLRYRDELASCPKPCSTICSEWAGAMATPSHQPRGGVRGSIWRRRHVAPARSDQAREPHALSARARTDGGRLAAPAGSAPRRDLDRGLELRRAMKASSRVRGI